MDIVVTYDVNTETKEGRRRLRRVAKVCEGHGQRVQLSVFECSLTATQLEQFKQRLIKEIDAAKDSLRIYKLHAARADCVESFGLDGYRDFRDTLVL
jgi:CRISPR-associated protein Cas2